MEDDGNIPRHSAFIPGTPVNCLHPHFEVLMFTFLQLFSRVFDL